MAEINASDARTLANANSSNISDELDAIYTFITARATSGFYSGKYSLLVASTKAPVIAHLTTDLGYVVTVDDDEITLNINWEAP